MTFPFLYWPPGVTGAACGLASVFTIYIFRGLRQKTWAMSYSTALTMFLGTAVFPSALCFLLYPFASPKPNLADHALFLPVAGLGLLWTVFAAIKQGMQ
jgi:hypothetical protein